MSEDKTPLDAAGQGQPMPAPAPASASAQPTPAQTQLTGHVGGDDKMVPTPQDNEAQFSKYRGEIDGLRAQMEEQQKQYAQLNKKYEAMIEQQKKENVFSKIKQSNGEIKPEYQNMSCDEIMQAFVKENAKINIEGKNKNYIEGVFETVCRHKIDTIQTATPDSGLSGTITRPWEKPVSKLKDFSIVQMKAEQDKIRREKNENVK